MFILSPSLLITSPARASWGFCLIRDAWGLCLHRADERSAVKRQTAWKQKDSFSCAHTLEQSQRQLFPSRVSQTLWLDLSLFSLSLSIPSTVLVADLWKYQKGESKGPTKVAQRGGNMFNWSPPVYSVLSCSDTPSSLDNWDSGAVQQSNHHRGCTPVTSSPSDQGRWLFSTHKFNPWWVGLCVMRECKSKRGTVAAACGFVLKGRGHSNYWLCHQSMMKVLLAWRASCSNMRLMQFKAPRYNLVQGRAVNFFERENRIFIHQLLLYVITSSAPADGKAADSHDRIQSAWW